MPLSNQVFTPGNPPDHSAALTQIALHRPDVFKAFSQGYDDAQKRQLQLQQYREAKVKADLAEALYPQQSQLQLAMLQARLAAVQNPTGYGVSPSAITPITTSAGTTVGSGAGATTTSAPPAIAPYQYKTLDSPMKLQVDPSNFPGAPSTSLPIESSTPFGTTDSEPASFNPYADAAA